MSQLLEKMNEKKKVSFEEVNSPILGPNSPVTTENSFTPSMEQISKVKPAPMRRNFETTLSTNSTICKPNYEDILKRVSVIIHQHVSKHENLCRNNSAEFHNAKIDLFSEENFLLPQYIYQFVRSPISRMGFQYSIKKVKPKLQIPPTINDIYIFMRDTYVKAQLTPECGLVCLIYCERLMEQSKVPLLTQTWRPIVMCGLLLGSKVWQDIGSWNIDFAEIFPQYSLRNINQLERLFCSEIKWDLYISTSVYAKYYFALRSLSEKQDFRRNYNMMVNIEVPGASEIAERTVGLKEHGRIMSMAQSL